MDGADVVVPAAGPPCAKLELLVTESQDEVTVAAIIRDDRGSDDCATRPAAAYVDREPRRPPPSEGCIHPSGA